MEEVIIVLGSPNSPTGILGEIALSRLNLCITLFNPAKNAIICTGGFGAHFNTGPKPHAEYAKEYLLSKGIDKSYFMQMALSSNTVQDATMVKQILSNNPLPCKIITSDFHLERVKLIFDQVLANNPKEYFGASYEVSEEQRIKLIEHEKKAIHSIIKNGIYF